MRVLIADDEPTYSALLEAVLSASGFEIIVARDGREAWEMVAREDSPQLALLDWSMPRMDGIEICRRARSELGSLSPYIILLTGRDSEDDFIEATEAGADDFFTKIANMTELLLRVNAGRRIVELQNQLSSVKSTVAIQAAELDMTCKGIEARGDEVAGDMLAAIRSIARYAEKLEEICDTEQCRFFSRDIFRISQVLEKSIIELKNRDIPSP